MADLVDSTTVKNWLEISDSVDDTRLGYVTSAVSGQVRGWCGRSFHIEANQVASARYFTPHGYGLVMIDDCYEITGVATDDGDDGTYSTTWSAGDYQARPVGNIGAMGTTGWPYTSLVAVEAREFPIAARPAVKVTAKWGWSALPDDVRMACLMLCADMINARTGSDMFNTEGTYTTIRRNSAVRDLLQPYRTSGANDARFLVG